MVIITYLLKSDKQAKSVKISNVDYFDPLEDESESYEIDGCAKYQEPHKYLPVDEDDIKWIIVEEPYDHGIAIFRHQYLSGTKAIMIHSKFPNGDEEIIHQADIGEGAWVTFRTLKPAGKSWSTTTSALSDKNENLTELAHDWSWEARIAFCDADIIET